MHKNFSIKSILSNSQKWFDIFVYFIAQKLLPMQKFSTFVRFSDYYFNILHSFSMSLFWDSYAFICTSLAYLSDICFFSFATQFANEVEKVLRLRSNPDWIFDLKLLFVFGICLYKVSKPKVNKNSARCEIFQHSKHSLILTIFFKFLIC